MKILVVITSHPEYEKFLLDAIDSVEKQECDYITIKDLTFKLVSVSQKRNSGIKHAIENKFDYLIFLDADDKLEENYIEETTKKVSEADIVYTNYRTFGLRNYVGVCNEDHLHISSLINVKKVFIDAGVRFKDVPFEDRVFYNECKDKGITFTRCLNTKLFYRKHDLYNQKNCTDKK